MVNIIQSPSFVNKKIKYVIDEAHVPGPGAPVSASIPGVFAAAAGVFVRAAPVRTLPARVFPFPASE